MRRRRARRAQHGYRHRPRPWSGYVALQEILSALRPRLPGVAGSAGRYAWFVRGDPQVAETYGHAGWGMMAHRRALETAVAAGDDVGLHVHSFRWSDARAEWITDLVSQPWVDHCVDVGLEAFEDALGRRCETFRFGDHWLNDATVARLEARGVRFDLTLEPGMPVAYGPRRSPPRAGSLPDLTSMPTVPYRPSRRDFRRADTARTGGLWIIPLSTGQLGRGLAMLRRLYRRLTRPGWAFPDTVTLNPALHPVLFRDLLERLLAAPGTRLLALAVRSEAGLSRRRAAHVRRNFEQLLGHRRGPELAFCTPAQALAQLGATDPQG